MDSIEQKYNLNSLKNKNQIVKILTLIFCALLLQACSSTSTFYQESSVVQTEYLRKINYETELGLIIIPVEIAGETYRFLFDTGAPMLISSELSHRLKLQTLTSQRVTDSQGKSRLLNKVRLPRVDIAGIGFFNTGTIVGDLDLSPKISCMNIDGIIGANLMRHSYWKIDFVNQQISFASNKKYFSDDTSAAIKLDFNVKNTFTPQVNLLINNKRQTKIIFDTGSVGYLSLGLRHLKNNKSIINSFSGYRSAGLFGSRKDTIHYVNAKLRVDSFNQNALIEYKMNKKSKLLGLKFMQQFNVILDWDKQQIELYPTAVTKQVKTEFDFSTAWREEQLIIGGLIHSFHTKNNKLSIGDKVKRLNQWDFSAPNRKTYCNMITSIYKKPVDNMTVELFNGDKFSSSKIVIKTPET